MRFLMFAFLLATSGSVFGQTGLSVDLATCQGFARDNLFDTKGMTSWDYRYASHVDTVCRNTAESTNTKLGLASSFASLTSFSPISFSGDYARNKETLDKYCKHISDLSVEEKRTFFSSRTFGDAMAGVANSCISVVRDSITSRGMVFAYAAPNNPELTEFYVTLEARPSPANTVKLVGLNGTNTRCVRNGAPMNFSEPIEIPNYSPFSFICEKYGSSGTSLSFNTSNMGSTNWVRLPGATDQELSAIRAEIDTLRGFIGATSNRKIYLTDCSFPTGPGYDNVTVGHDGGLQNSWNQLDRRLRNDCPANQVMIGIDSDHWNSNDDRGFAFKCCKIEWR